LGLWPPSTGPAAPSSVGREFQQQFPAVRRAWRADKRQFPLSEAPNNNKKPFFVLLPNSKKMPFSPPSEVLPVE
jgi:hypothetical protein